MMTRYEVLITAPYFVPVLADWLPIFERHCISAKVLHVTERAEEDDLLPVVASIDGIICGDDRITARVLEAAPRLKVVCKWGTGIDSIDQLACRQHHVLVKNTADAFSVPVADSVLSYILAFCRNSVTMDQAMKAGVWRKIPGRSLSEMTVGIIGVGNVGRRVAERAHAFGCRLLGTDLRPIDDFVKSVTGIKQVPLELLLAESDFVSLNCDLNESSHHLIRAETLKQMKRTAYLINTARGPIIREPDLVAALEQGSLAGAALDVFEQEPLPATSALLKMNNVLLAPHNSNSSPSAWQRVHENTVANLFAGLGITMVKSV